MARKKSKKKKLIEIKGTKFEKICLLLQVIDVIFVLGFMIVGNIMNLDSKLIMSVISIATFICIFLMLLPQMLKEN